MGRDAEDAARSLDQFRSYLFRKLAYQSNDDIIAFAHDDDTYKRSQYGEVIFEGAVGNTTFPDVDRELTERLTDLADSKFVPFLIRRFELATKNPPRNSDWRRLYFGESKASAAV